MPTPKKQKKPAAGTPGNPLPVIPEAVLAHFAPEGPMTAEAVQSASMAFKKALIERAMQGELSHHLGYPLGATPAMGGNHRNGASGKTVLTEDGPLRIEVPRDREGSFEPLLIPKHERRFTGFDDKIVAMYARGMTVREIQALLAEQYGTEVSPEFISSVTDEVMAEVTAWQARPLERKRSNHDVLPGMRSTGYRATSMNEITRIGDEGGGKGRCTQAPRRERVATAGRRAAAKRPESAGVLRARGVVRAVAHELAPSARSRSGTLGDCGYPRSRSGCGCIRRDRRSVVAPAGYRREGAA